MWSVSTPAACLLLSRFVPATARLLAEFRRLRGGLPPAEARKFAPAAQDLAKAPMMGGVRLCACQTSRAPDMGEGLWSACPACQTPCTSSAWVHGSRSLLWSVLVVTVF